VQGVIEEGLLGRVLSERSGTYRPPPTGPWGEILLGRIAPFLGVTDGTGESLVRGLDVRHSWAEFDV
jgi:hypothetical protein